MSRWLTLVVVLVFVLSGSAGLRPAAQELEAIKLPPPQTDGGKPLMQVLKSRHTSRVFDTTPLPAQVLSNLLWAGFGVNREDGKRTAPSAVNWQEIDIYVFLREGTYVYQAKENLLKPVAAGDLRGATGSQPFVATVPVNLVYIADFAKTGKIPPEQRDIWSPADAGFIAQNVYLFCASEGLNVV
ncbi:MAG: SagB/ThcOx family dehydrogenase, partial [Acidobacteria bacterium]|nr:SagB/ThcOx family dehydrogenase [Acidobacteriota bacterium]